ncbi:hypothetical protein SeMB42_g00401 [Synchytrium endobioticum]|uniref:N-acetyltransferase domain-containing protein n=1 Tax=Synchytrium endobioticum TaxID=286115 RepID=A0A507DR18_9FUNG|nr:hypothetical protein SeLEV6574_g02553 [Synchytrium endobioticum]TPX54174.1 hypothetical protein SeMB42_g00401 [Synchytrium endobioticum]
MSELPVHLIEIREATVEDVPVILSFIKVLAEYEKLSHDVTADEETLRESLFGTKSSAKSLLASYDGESAGFALYFFNFSSFTGKRGLYLEDIFVKPEYRKHGIGTALLKKLAQVAQKEDVPKLEWVALKWNAPAIDFYSGLGAVAMDEWTVFRLQGEKLKRLSSS